MSNAWLAIICSLLLFAYGCPQKTGPVVVQEPVVTEQEPEEPEEAQLCGTGNILQKDECFFELAKSNSNPETCKNIYSLGTLDSCYAFFADSDLEVCKKITDSEMKASCLTENAKNEESEDICKLIEDIAARENCLKEVLPPCMLIADVEERQLCLAYENNDYSLCKTDWCLFEYAQNMSEEDACEMIATQSERFACTAVSRKDVSACFDASLSPIQDACIEIASKELDKPEGCDLATNGSDYKNSCYLYFAVENLDTSFCKKAAPEEERDQCYSDYSIRTATVDACPDIIESLNRIGCYYQSALQNRMPSLCNPLENSAQRTDCYSKGTFSKEGPAPIDCAFVESEVWRDKCYYQAAVKNQESSLCAFITPGHDKDACESLFGGPATTH